ncbi:acylphosphatase [archaeon]|nr:acylphosphatase [archaeon]|tara:strand:- start:3697 stop:3969 length:273 start_codon:yes stop_codon:yes gene_type:complete
MKRVHIFISGIVQGVFFRSNIKEKANKLNLKGFVKNLPNGKVEAIFEGKEENINEILKFCKKGPSGANIKDVEIKEGKVNNEFNSFEVRY